MAEPSGATEVGQEDSGRGTAAIWPYQVTVAAASTPHDQIVPPRPGRRGVLIRNLDAAITVYLGNVTDDDGTGFPLKAGESVRLFTASAVYGYPASATALMAFLEEY